MARCGVLLIGVLLLVRAAPALSVQDAFNQFQSQTVTGVTVISHGFTPFDDGGDYMLPLAEAIRDRLLTQSEDPVWLLDYDLAGVGAQGQFDPGSSVLPSAPGEAGHAILLFDWATESNERSRWWAEAAGDALFAMGTGLGLFDPTAGAAPPVHLIGHSFGSVVTTEAVERLAGYNVAVDQVTLLDPHDFDQADVPIFDNVGTGGQSMEDLGAPNGYGATIWNNVDQADVYYQTRGNQGGLAGVLTADPEGRPLPGAYNRLLDGADELPAGNPYGTFGVDSDHNYVNHTFYLGTVLGELPPGADPPANPTDYNSAGWAHSIHNANRVPMPTPEFFGPGQDHQHTNAGLASPTGEPNTQGLAALGLTAETINTARWAPEWAPGDIVNGDFESGARDSGSEDIIAGWSHHGGGGRSMLQDTGENRYLRLETFDASDNVDDAFKEVNDSRTHNHLHVPHDASGLAFDMRVAIAHADAAVEILLGETLISTLVADTVSDWASRIIGIPLAHRGRVSTLTVRLLDGDAIVDFDNFAFSLPTLAGDYNADGRVDTLDYAVWRENLTMPFGTLANDPTGQAVGQAQFQAWLDNYGAGVQPLPPVVPAPSAVLLVLAGLIAAPRGAVACASRR